MTNLPITTSAPQAAAASKQSANSADSGDAQNAQPFGEVLARQIKDPNAKDAKADSKLAADALAQLGKDTKAGKKDVADHAKTDISPMSPRQYRDDLARRHAGRAVAASHEHEAASGTAPAAGHQVRQHRRQLVAARCRTNAASQR